jgi:protein SCO1
MRLLASASIGALLLALSVVVGRAGAAPTSGPGFVGPRIAHPSTTPDFALRDQNGRIVRLSAQRGKVVVLTFLYSHCPDTCPLTAIHIQDALRRLGSRRRSVVALAVTVDPKGDTPAAVRGFVRSHRLGPQFHYLTGMPRALTRIWRLYGVTSVRVGGPDPDHTLYVLLLDRAGKTRVLFDATAAAPAIAHDLRLLLG